MVMYGCLGFAFCLGVVGWLRGNNMGNGGKIVRGVRIMAGRKVTRVQHSIEDGGPRPRR